MPFLALFLCAIGRMAERTPSPTRSNRINAEMDSSIHDAQRMAARRAAALSRRRLDAQPPPALLPDATARHLRFANSRSPSASASPEENTPPITALRFQEHSITPKHISFPCKDKFKHYGSVTNTDAKRYLRKLMDICTTTAERCENPRAILTHLRKKYNKNQKQHTIHIVSGEPSPFHQLYQYWASQDAPAQSHVLRGLMHNDGSFPRFAVRIEELNDLGAGVTRNFFQMVVDDMVKRLFVPIDGKDSKSIRYTIRADIEPAKCKFVGEFLAFCVINELPVPIHFSRSLLARMIYKESEIDDDMDVMYMITDYPETSQVILNQLMFSEEMELPNFDAVKEVIRKRARDSVSAAAKLVATHFFLKADARRHNWTIDRLDQLISGNVITPVTISALLHTVRTQSHQQDQMALNLFAKMMNKKKEDTPFVEALMQYWTGMKKIDVTLIPPYQIAPIPRGLPTASTCFNQLKIPMDVANEDELIQRFEKAINLSGTTFGLD